MTVEKKATIETTPLKGNSTEVALSGVIEGVDKGVESIVSSVVASASKDENKSKNAQSTSTMSQFFASLVAKRATKKKLSKHEKKKILLSVLTDKEKKLKKTISKITKSKKKFSAYKIENLAQELRYIKSVILGIVNKTIKNIEALYRKFVLKISDSPITG